MPLLNAPCLWKGGAVKFGVKADIEDRGEEEGLIKESAEVNPLLL